MTPATSKYDLGDETSRSSPGTARHWMVADDDEMLLLPICVPDAARTVRFSALGMVPRLLLAAVLTSPVMFFNPEEESRMSGAYSALFRRDTRTRKRITLRQARLLALQVLAETEDGIRRDRLVEARLLASIWDEEQA